jgi:hypothetical protein
MASKSQSSHSESECSLLRHILLLFYQRRPMGLQPVDLARFRHVQWAWKCAETRFIPVDADHSRLLYG